MTIITPAMRHELDVIDSRLRDHTLSAEEHENLKLKKHAILTGVHDSLWDVVKSNTERIEKLEAAIDSMGKLPQKLSPQPISDASQVVELCSANKTTIKQEVKPVVACKPVSTKNPYKAEDKAKKDVAPMPSVDDPSSTL